ncbi:S53 family peptidase [Jatrophihabitans sp. YIM 134969]
MPVPHSRRVIALATAAIAVAGGATLAAAPAASAAPSGTVTLQNTLPRWLSKATAATGATPKVATSQTVRVYLAPNGGLAALKAKVADLTTPGSAHYGQWLTTAQYNAAYKPTAAAVKSVTSYLQSKGLTVSGTAAGNRYVTASGSPATLGKAFGTTLATFTHDGQTVTAPKSAVTLPAAVGNAVLTVTGLDTTKQIKTHDHLTDQPAAPTKAAPAATPSDDVTPPPAFVNAYPCNTNYGNLLATYQADFSTPLPKFQGQTLPYVPCGYTGPQFRSAYEGQYAAGTPDTGLDGSGVTVAITDAYSWQLIKKDANTYAENHGDGSYVKGQLTIVPSPTGYNRQADCDPSGWSGEETLDVEAVHAMAPSANIKYFASASCYDDDFTDTLARVVDDNTAKLVTNSWSDSEENESSAQIAAYEQVFMQGAVQGQSFLFSSGDSGDNVASTGIKSVGYPSSDPYVTGAGGTSTGIAYGSKLFQTSWGTYSYSLAADGKSWGPGSFNAGSGGGFSTLFNRPTWQTGVVPTGTSSGRGVPDVSMDADANTGMLIGQTQTFSDGSVHYSEYRLGGTSLASPLLAGFFALSVQAKGSGFGLLNPLLYQQKHTIDDVLPTPNYVGVVRVNNNNGEDATDGLSYFVRTFGHDSSLPVTKGWDPSTGLGVPGVKFLGKYTPAAK